MSTVDVGYKAAAMLLEANDNYTPEPAWNTVKYRQLHSRPPALPGGPHTYSKRPHV